MVPVFSILSCFYHRITFEIFFSHLSPSKLLTSFAHRQLLVFVTQFWWFSYFSYSFIYFFYLIMLYFSFPWIGLFPQNIHMVDVHLLWFVAVFLSRRVAWQVLGQVIWKLASACWNIFSYLPVARDIDMLLSKKITLSCRRPTSRLYSV